jgi:aerobic-type carbon monoxide dehydrogenase small subunit (CoxS/CutS family)
MPTSRHRITLTVNGSERSVDVESRELLTDVIRHRLGLTGTHVGCEHGACGACTIVMDGQLVRSCLLFGVQTDGAEITTIEALGRSASTLHPVQQAFWERHGLQCGFCTPGMVLTAMKLLEANPSPTEEQIRMALSGNVCRCTGYVFIVEAVQAAAELLAETGVAK